MKLISDAFSNPTAMQYLTEGAGSEKKLYIAGPFMQAEKLNRNRRIYPKQILTSAVSKYIKEQVSTGRAVGELNHPSGPAINLDKVSHRITELCWDGNDVLGKALLLETPMGKIAKSLVEGGVQLGVSSRGMGTLVETADGSSVKPDYFLNAIDIVANPSAPDAFVNGILENVEYYLEGDKIVEHKIDQALEKLNETRKFQSSAVFIEAQLKAFHNLLQIISK